MPAFDPYHKWLGIPPAEQPPNNYRLLGVGLFEQDSDVIESAADRQMVHVQAQKHGPHADSSQRLLNELAAARVCLLDPQKKAAYDVELRGKTAARHVARAIAPAAPPPPMPAPAPRPLPAMREAAAGTALLEEGRDELSHIVEQQGVEVRQPASAGRYATRRKKSPLPIVLGSLAAGGAVLAIVIVLASGNKDDENGGSRTQKSPGVVESKSKSQSPSRPLPDSPALWKPEQETSPQPPKNPRPTTNPGKRPGPVRLPDPEILGPDGKPKNGEPTPGSEDDDTPPQPSPEPSQPQPPAPRLPVPSEDDLKTARREMREAYADDFKSLGADERKFKLAEKLFKAAPREAKGSAMRYVMTETSSELSQEAGVPIGAANAMGALVEEFDIPDPVQVVANAFYEASRNARTPEGRDAAVQYVPFLMNIAMRHDHFAGARRVVQAGKAVAASSPAAKRGPLNDEFDLWSRGVAMLDARHRAATAARETLKNASDDAAANETVGLYAGLLKDDWPAGAAPLAKAADAALKSLGQKETATLPGGRPPSSKQMTELAEGWATYATQTNSPLKEAALLRARHWHETSLGKLRSSNEKKTAKAAIEALDKQLTGLDFAAFLTKLRTAKETSSK